MTLKKSHFWYNKRQRNGILFLVFLIVLFQLVYFYVDSSNFSEKAKIDATKLAKIEQEIDSLKQVEIEKELENKELKPFNPSFITDFKGYQLGMSPKEIDKLLAYRKQGKYINSTEEFQQVTGVSDSLLNKISPYFKFPDWVIKKNESNKKEEQNILPVKDINTASTSNFKTIDGINNKLAERIVKYRAKIGGFYFDDQLYDVYGLKTSAVKNILRQYKVLQKPEVNKLNINTASFKEILAIPYIDYELTKNIFNYKNNVKTFKSLDELKKIEGFPSNKFDRIAVYLEVK